jgi:hypothetical protein
MYVTFVVDVCRALSCVTFKRPCEEYIPGVSGGIVNIVRGGSMEYSE